MEPKAKTFQEKMGFVDSDLKKPKHDELMIWLDSNIENIAKNVFSLKEGTKIIRIDKKWEYPVISQNGSSGAKFTVGFVDFVADITLENNEGDKGYRIMYIEVKTEIPSLGELIRQINHYRTFLNGPQFVMCPDSKHKDMLASQGIGWIDYTP